MIELDLLESKELREKLVSKTEVLEKVKKLLLIPGTKVATVKQVSEFYEVAEANVKMLYSSHKDELDNDGACLKSYKDFLKSSEFTLETKKGKAILSSGYVRLEVPNRGLRVFPRRAILRIGMLLRDSPIAKEVRTQLLNIEEKTSTEIKTEDIDNEQALMLSVGMAYASGDLNAFAIATTKMMNFKNQHIEKLEESKRALAQGILEWEDRSRINFAVRKMAAFARISVPKAWTELYKQLKNKYHIDLQSRGKQPWIQYIKEDEWQKVIKSFSALCEYYELEPSEMFHDLELKENV